jgi:hypothetical protein
MNLQLLLKDQKTFYKLLKHFYMGTITHNHEPELDNQEAQVAADATPETEVETPQAAEEVPAE